MANRAVPPLFNLKNADKIVINKSSARRIQSGPTFNRLTVLWVDNSGVPFNTTGFNAALYRGSTLIQTAAFDRFGVVFFSLVTTLTTANYTLVVYDSFGRIYRTKSIPAGVEAFSVIG